MIFCADREVTTDDLSPGSQQDTGKRKMIIS